MVTSGAAAMVWGALGSSDSNVRGAACHILMREREHFDSRNRQDRKLWNQIMDSVRNSQLILSANSKDIPELPSVSSVFLCRLCQTLNQSLNKLYIPLSNFLLVKPNFDFSIVPEMRQFLHSSEVDYIEHRIWMLELLRDGVKSYNDFKIIQFQFGYKFIMDFYNCKLANEDSKILILSIINNTVKIPKAAYILFNQGGLAAWLQNVILGLKSSYTDQIKACIRIVSNLKNSLVGYELFMLKKDGNKVNFQSMINKCCPKDTSFHLCLMVKGLLKVIERKIGMAFLDSYFNCLKHVAVNNYNVFSKEDIELLLSLTQNIVHKQCDCRYLLKYGCNFAADSESFAAMLRTTDLSEISTSLTLSLREFVISWIKHNN